MIGTSEAFLLPVQVDSPEVVNAVLNRLLVAVLAKECGSYGKECHILQFKLEDSCIHKKRAVN